jgi:hypothetical protein
VKTVLIIGPDFAPSSLPPATRIRFFASHLAEFGWQPIVLTSKPEFYEWSIDPENERLLPPTIEVIRTKAFSSRWTRKVGIGDIGMRILWHHWQALKRVCRERKVDLIFIPVPPYVPMVLGRLAFHKFRIPYVIDYIDPWVTDYYKKLPRSERPPKWMFADTLSRTLEPISVKRVAHITGVSKGTTDSVVQRYDWLSEANATEIPYGAEAQDFEYVRKTPRQNPIFDRSDGLFHLSSVGACIPGMHEAVRAIFKAVQIGLNRSPEKFKRLRMHFVGTSYAANGHNPKPVMALAHEAGLDQYVDEHPKRIPYLESLQVMLDSDALFLVGTDEPHYTASKIFPYLLAQRPLLAVFHDESSVVQIMNEAQAGEVVTFNSEQSPESQSEQISNVIEHFVSNEFESGTRWDAVEPYTTRAMTARLVQAFEGVVNGS